MTFTKTIVPGVLISLLLLICMGQSGSCGKSTNKKTTPAANKSAQSNSTNTMPSTQISKSTVDDQNMNKSKAQTINPTAETEWGGDHVRLVMNEGGADLEFDCAHGEITEPLVADSEGNFNVRGTFSREAGPVPSTGGPAPRKASYVGQIVNDKMSFKIQLTDPDQTTETFHLIRGGSGRLWKCR
jgi:hypothetical protein